MNSHASQGMKVIRSEGCEVQSAHSLMSDREIGEADTSSRLFTAAVLGGLAAIIALTCAFISQAFGEVL